MLPGGVLSTTPVTAGFLPPRNVVKEPLVDFALGGVNLNDPSQGLEVYVWRGRYIDGDIVIDVPGEVAPITVLSLADITEFQFTFDQNMQIVLTYVVDDDAAFYRFFNDTATQFVTEELAQGTITPRCCLDDSRAIAGEGMSDVLVTYMRDGTLYYRQQRDRYEDEYELATDLSAYKLGQVGMNRVWRFQWQLIPLEIEQ